mgnify:CR=1 FL=1
MTPSPVFRKPILPWYDTNAACVILLFFMAAVLLFGLAGMRVAGFHAQYRAYIGLPIFLVGLSGFGCVSLLIRLIRRRYGQPNE